MSMSQEELQKLLDEFEQSKIAQTPQWKIDRDDRLRSQSLYAGKIRGKNISREHLLKASKKASDLCKQIVLRYDKDGNYLNKYNSLSEAALDNNATAANISRACNPKDTYCKTINGYVFRKQFKNNIPLKINTNLDRPKGICEHCKKEVSTSNLKRWHGDNCKMKK